MKNHRFLPTSITILLTVFLFVCIPSTAMGADISSTLALDKVSHGALLVDVRSAEEYAAGHVEGAINIPHDSVEARLAAFGNNKNREIVLYCRSGRRSDLAKQTLLARGFHNVFNAGGYDDLKGDCSDATCKK